MFVCAMRAGSSEEEEEEDVMDILQVESLWHSKTEFLYATSLNLRDFRFVYILYRLLAMRCIHYGQSIGT